MIDAKDFDVWVGVRRCGRGLVVVQVAAIDLWTEMLRAYDVALRMVVDEKAVGVGRKTRYRLVVVVRNPAPGMMHPVELAEGKALPPAVLREFDNWREVELAGSRLLGIGSEHFWCETQRQFAGSATERLHGCAR